MIKVYIPTDKEFNYKECKKLYRKNKKLLNDEREFRNVIKDSFFYSFFDEEKHLGCIYYYCENNKLYVNAFAYRHNHLLNIECFKMSFDWFNCDIYARSKHKTAIMCLLRCGFKKISDNLYKYEREN